MKHIYKIFLLVSWILINNLLAVSNTTFDEEAFFQKAFKDTLLTSQKLYAPLFINNTYINEILVSIQNDQIFVQSDSINTILSYTNKQKIINHSTQLVALNTLNNFNIQSTFNKIDGSIHVRIPALLLVTNNIHFNTIQSPMKNLISPNEFSGVINLDATYNYYQDNLRTKNSSISHLNSNFFINYNSLVLESGFNYSNDKYTRSLISISKDNQKNQLRYRFGEISSQSHSRLQQRNIMGISVSKSFAIGQKNQASKISQYEFMLYEDSDVEIYINDIYLQTIKLKLGHHRLYDLPLTVGYNNITLNIINVFGKSKLIHFNKFEDYRLMTQGVHHYGVATGIEIDQFNNKITYKQNKPELSFFYDYGLTDYMTFKSGSMFRQSANSYATDIILGTKIGTFNSYYTHEDTNTTKSKNIGMFYSTSIVKKVALNLSASKQNIYSKSDDTNKFYLRYRASLNTQIFNNISTSLSIEQQKNINETQNIYTVNMGKQLTKEIFLNSNYKKELSSDNSENNTLYFTFTYRFSNNKNYRYTRKISEESSNSLGLDYYNTNLGMRGNVNYEETKSLKNLSLSTNFEKEKLRVYSQYRNTNSIHTPSKEQITLNLSTAIAFVQDRWSFTNPIDRSFILVSKEYASKNKESYVIKSDDYSQQRIHVENKDLKIGSSIYNPTRNFKTKYKSGSLMKVKIENFYSITGILQHKDIPVSLVAISIKNKKNKKIKKSFTNKKGNFIIDSLNVGKYQGEYFDSKSQKRMDFEFEVKKPSIQGKIFMNIINIGILKVRERENKKVK